MDFLTNFVERQYKQSNLLFVVLFGLIMGIAMSGCESSTAQKNDYQLVWSDEFDYQGAPDPERWSFELGDGCPTLCGWGNNEREYYTKELKNVRVDSGKLIIQVHADRADSLRPYSSAKINTKNKGDWQYGKIVVSARLPQGKGTWPAIWMLPTTWKYGGWPDSGEIDIMEHVGFDPGNIHGTVHTKDFNHTLGTQKGDSIQLETAFDEFHEYAIEWTPEEIRFMVNDEIYNIFTNHRTGSGAWPFDEEFYLILNIAVGGNWGGKHGIDNSIWPQKMEIDYVRVYQLPTMVEADKQ